MNTQTQTTISQHSSLVLAIVIGVTLVTGCNSRPKKSAPIQSESPSMSMAPSLAMTDTAAEAPAPQSGQAPVVATVRGPGGRPDESPTTASLQQLVEQYNARRSPDSGFAEALGSRFGGKAPEMDPGMQVLVKAGGIEAIPPAPGGRKFVYNTQTQKVEIR